MAQDLNPWPKVITVDKSIIKALSQSTYDSFPNALKEVITNSYDAFATEVNINVNLEHETIIISDNGGGMNESEFDFYLRIAGKKREKTESGRSRRKKIGQFGIGFLSVFPFFKTYSIETKKAGTNVHMTAAIPSHLYFDSNNQFVNISDIKISGKSSSGKYKDHEHFTEITLQGFTEITKSFMFPKLDVKKGRYSIDNPKYFEPIRKLEWVLAEDLPLNFESPSFQEWFSDEDNSLPFKVFFNSKELLRKVYSDKFILEQNEEPYSQLGRIKYKYVIATNKEPVRPHEGRFLKIRNLNCGVGKRENFIGDSIQGGYPRLQQLTGEIHILEGMNDLIKVSRDSFNYSSEYEELRNLFASKMIRYSAKLQEESNIEKESDLESIRSLKNLETLETTSKAISTELSGKNDQVKLFEESSRNDSSRIEKENTRKSESNDSSVSDIKRKEAVSTLELEGYKFRVKTDKWEFESHEYPACRIENGNELIINSNYPLFKGVKHTDVFIKLHVLLLLNLEDGVLSKEAYDKMSHQVLDVYRNYWKP